MPVVQKQNAAKPIVGKPKDVISRIAPIAFDDNQGIKILLYGRSGSGKTTLWSTFPAPILSIVCSGGIKSGELRSINMAENQKRIKQVVIEEASDMKKIIDHVSHTEVYKTVVLDHVSGLQDKILSEVLGLDELPAQMGWGVATQQQYGQMSLQCKEILRALLSLSCNVVIIGQERESHVEETSELLMPTVGVALTPSLAGWLNPAVDYICQTFIRPTMVIKKTKIGDKIVETKTRGTGVEYCLRTAPHDIYTTKFRIPKGNKLPEVLVDPSYQAIKKLIDGQGG